MMIPTHLGTYGAIEAASDELFNLLIVRNEDLEHEKLALLSENDGLTAENIQLRQELAAKHREVA